MKKALLLSASSYKDTGYLTHSKGWIKEFLGKNWDEEILFIPYAGVRRTNDEYELRVQNCLENKNVKSIHKFEDKKAAIKNAKTIAVGGGNTFMLLKTLYELDLIEPIKEAVKNGTLYFGWSAGANIAGKTMMTTNDMPIAMPKSFDSLGIFPYQINPHFISGKIPGHNGESREERLEEFLIANPSEIVYALPEGTALNIAGDEAELIGYADALKFEYKKEVSTIKLGSKIKL
ncbi:MAG: dipeptidase PepE [Campylobacteraceae bacterium]|nr:dipeptidase PepE [Campylobacteraceae bacterium]